MKRFDSLQYRKIYIFVKKAAEDESWISLISKEKAVSTVHMESDWYRMVVFPLEEETSYELNQNGIEIVQAYLGESDDILETGTCFLDVNTGKPISLECWYQTPWREQVHFVPFVNWLNDPNGLCWYKGYYHLFYQSNPFGQKWDDMYWGHAVSKDLIHWTHLPHVLEPQKELWKNKELKGGAFSGSAIAEEEGIHLYLTRHEGPVDDGESTKEWQTQAICRDGLCVENETVIIEDRPEGASVDFRDPKVQKISGEDYMVLGSSINQIPSILLYKKGREGNWNYQGPLIEETTSGIKTFECPDFFPLGDKYVAVGAWMHHYDNNKRYQMTRCYIGSFHGKELLVEKEQWFDFGSNFYAVQSFEHKGRRIAIGWVSDFYEEHKTVAHGAYGSFALPRQLTMQNNHLYISPVEECYGLLEKQIIPQEGQLESEGITIPGNSFYFRAKLKGDGDFSIILARDGHDTLSLVRSNGVTGLISTKPQVTDIKFSFDCEKVREIQVFIDRRVAEVFLNKGEASGTKVFYQDSTDGYLKTEFVSGELTEMEIWTMKSIWK